MSREELEIEQIRATISKLNAENAKLQFEPRFPSVIVAAMVIGVISPLLAAIITVFG